MMRWQARAAMSSATINTPSIFPACFARICGMDDEEMLRCAQHDGTATHEGMGDGPISGQGRCNSLEGDEVVALTW